MKFGVVLIGLALLFPVSASAGIVLPQVGRDAKPLTIRHHHVRVEVDNQVATTTVQQTFENHTNSELEGNFYFDLPADAAVVDFVQWIGGERIGSEIAEKNDAEKSYEKRKASGESPALLQLLPNNKFQAKVSGIPANGVRRTEFTYSQILNYEGGKISYGFPIGLERIYTTPIDNVSFSVVVKDQKLIKGVTSAVSGVATQMVNGNQWKAKGEWKNLVPVGRWDVNYEVQSREMGINFLTYREQGEDGYFVLMLAPQELTTDKDIVKKDVIFVFDKSGSMSGPKISQAREALKLSLNYMNPGDGFGVLGFSSGVDPFHNKVRPASKGNLSGAQKFASRFNAGGGTNIQDALRTAFKMLSKEKRPSAIVFLTDGVGNRPSDETVRLVDSLNERNTRVFAFGVGGDVNRQFLEKLGSSNRGHAQFLVDGVRIDDAVASFYSSISKPVLSDMDIDYGEITSTMTYPATLPDIYKGQQVVIVGRYRGHGKTDLMLTGGLNGSVKNHKIEVEFPKASSAFPFVPRIWAQRRIEHILQHMRLNGENAEMKTEVIALGKEFRIVTPYTSFVSKRTAPQVASLSPARIKPGDPEIWIDAPGDAERVTVHFPFGLTKKAFWDERKQRWVVRFLIPKNTPDGVYFVRIAITDAAGKTKLHTTNYTVDTKPAALEVKMASTVVTAGSPVHLSVRPVVTPLEVAEVMDLRSIGISVEAAKSLVDVKTVAVVGEDGRRRELDVDVNGDGWTGVLETLPTDAVGQHSFTVYSVDVAGNVWGHRYHYEIIPSDLVRR